jgi:regulatory factor X
MHTPLLPQEQHVAQFPQDPFPNQHVPAQHQILEHYDENDAAIMALQGQHGLFDQQQLHGMDLGSNPHMHAQIHNAQNGYYQPQPAHYGPHSQGVDYSHMQVHQPARPLSASGTSNGKGKKKANGVSSAANEKHEQELHDMLNRNQGRSLSDVGAEVLKNERTSKCEKSKQLFAMLWYDPQDSIAKRIF